MKVRALFINFLRRAVAVIVLPKDGLFLPYPWGWFCTQRYIGCTRTEPSSRMLVECLHGKLSAANEGDL